jgi:hypothetical protein
LSNEEKYILGESVMEFNIDPYVGAGPILLGMSREQVRNALGNNYREFKKSQESEMPTDAFEWCHVYYKKSGICEAIEFFRPANPVLFGRVLIDKPINEVIKYFQEMDEKIIIDGDGFTSNKLGIGIYAPYETVEGVIVFEKGYYENDV